MSSISRGNLSMILLGEEGYYEGDIINNKANGSGTFTCDNFACKGDFQDNKIHGNIKINYENGSIYEGEAKDGNIEGEGIFTYPLYTLVGNFKYGNLHGWGYITSNQIIYAGYWYNGMKDGTGIEITDGETIYIGKWEEDFKQDDGIIIHPNGTIIKTTWNLDSIVNQQLDDEKTIRYISGYVFKSKKNDDWGTPNGNGYIINKNDNNIYIYVGDLINGMKNGDGLEIVYNGTIHIGEWLDDMKQGHGTVIHPNGSITESIWNQDSEVN